MAAEELAPTLVGAPLIGGEHPAGAEDERANPLGGLDLPRAQLLDRQQQRFLREVVGRVSIPEQAAREEAGTRREPAVELGFLLLRLTGRSGRDPPGQRALVGPTRSLGHRLEHSSRG